MGSSSGLQDRRIWHLGFRLVAGFHRACPSTTLDKQTIELLRIVREPGDLVNRLTDNSDYITVIYQRRVSDMPVRSKKEPVRGLVPK